MHALSPGEDFLSFQEALAAEYSLERELGRGGMGIVYLAREVRLDRYVAIKLLPPALAARPELRERFLREARTSAKLSHPHIVQIHRVDERDGFVFFVMAYVDGQTLGARVRERGPMAVIDATRVIREVAWALAYAHLHGVIHRDVKPDNILLDRGSGRAMVTDFGIAHIGEQAAAEDEGLILGTAHFMSPEQASGLPIDGRSDLYSLGIVGYYALTGQLPFDAPTPHAVMGMQVAQPVPSLARIAPATPRAIAETLERCLAKNPAARWASGEALAEALDASAEQRRLVPAPIRAWIGSHSATVGLTTLFCIALAFPLTLANPTAGILTMTLSPSLAYLYASVAKTRRVFKAGYDHDDLVFGLSEHVQMRNEEMQFDAGGRRGAGVGAVARKGAYALLSASVVFMVAAGILRDWTYAGVLLGLFGGTAFAGVSSAAISQLFPRVRDERAEWRLRFWRGRVGRWVASLAELGLGARTAPSQLVHRPTEIALGNAASELFRTLPRETRRELAGLPNVIKRLEAEARAIRVRLDLFAQHLGAAGENVSRTAGLHSQRDQAERDLGTVVTALQNIRLDLLRLHGGANTVASLTTAIEAARELGARIGYAVEGQREADAALAPIPTPV